MYRPDRRFEGEMGMDRDWHKEAGDRMSLATELFPILASEEYHEAMIQSMMQAVRENEQMELDYMQVKQFVESNDKDTLLEFSEKQDFQMDYFNKYGTNDDRTISTDDSLDTLGESTKGYIAIDSADDARAQGSDKAIDNYLAAQNVDPKLATVYADTRNSIYTNIQGAMMRAYELSAEKLIAERKEEEQKVKDRLEQERAEIPYDSNERMLSNAEIDLIAKQEVIKQISDEELKEAMKEAVQEVILDDPAAREMFLAELEKLSRESADLDKQIDDFTPLDPFVIDPEYDLDLQEPLLDLDNQTMEELGYNIDPNDYERYRKELEDDAFYRSLEENTPPLLDEDDRFEDFINDLNDLNIDE